MGRVVMQDTNTMAASHRLDLGNYAAALVAARALL
ncbi:hypothetical protein ABH999_000664 [Bradyrhizobium yuanmingense]